MTYPSVANNYAVGVGSSSDDVAVPVFQNRNPTAYDTHYPLGKRWINTLTGGEFSFTQISSSSGVALATWTALAASSGGSVDQLSSNAGVALPSVGNINIFGSGGITTSATGSTLTITGSPEGLTWISPATGSQLVVNTGNVITTGDQTFTLPSAPPLGSVIVMVLLGGDAWFISMSGGQMIQGIQAGGAPISYSTQIQSNNSNFTTMTMVAMSADVWVIQSINGSITGA